MHKAFVHIHGNLEILTKVLNANFKNSNTKLVGALEAKNALYSQVYIIKMHAMFVVVH